MPRRWRPTKRPLSYVPATHDALLSVSLCQLRAGAWREGWIGYETRLRQSPWTEALPTFSGPRWDGIADLRGKRVLLASEQGLGDTIQFSRFARLVADRGASVILGVEPPLRRLMQGLAGVSAIAVPNDPDPVYDLYMPLMSLIAAVRPRAGSRGDRRSLPARRSGCRRGLAGASGRVARPEGRAGVGRRSPASRPDGLPDGSPPVDRAGTSGAAAGDGRCHIRVSSERVSRTCPPIVDWTDELGDFADTAALIEALDLVISVDTAVAHAAGALGRPVWMLNRFDRCWRWMWDRTDTPWYPTMRLFTQATPGEWDDVVAEVAAALAASPRPH